MSRSAVSEEHLAIFAHFAFVSVPSKPSSKRFSMRRWRALIWTSPRVCQKRALASSPARVNCAPLIARPRQARNHASQRVTSNVPCCVCSSMS